MFFSDNIFVFENYLKHEAALKILTYYNCTSPWLIAVVLSPVQIISSPAEITSHPCISGLHNNIFPNAIAPNAPNNIPRNLTYCYFASFLIVPLTLFISKPDSSSYLTTLIISSISSFEIVSATVRGAKSEGCPDTKICFWLAASVADTAAVNPNAFKTLLATGMRVSIHNMHTTSLASSYQYTVLAKIFD